MTDSELIEGLIRRDKLVTKYSLEKYLPLLLNTIAFVFNNSVDKDEGLFVKKTLKVRRMV